MRSRGRVSAGFIIPVRVPRRCIINANVRDLIASPQNPQGNGAYASVEVRKFSPTSKIAFSADERDTTTTTKKHKT